MFVIFCTERQKFLVKISKDCMWHKNIRYAVRYKTEAGAKQTITKYLWKSDNLVIVDVKDVDVILIMYS